MLKPNGTVKLIDFGSAKCLTKSEALNFSTIANGKSTFYVGDERIKGQFPLWNKIQE